MSEDIFNFSVYFHGLRENIEIAGALAVLRIGPPSHGGGLHTFLCLGHKDSRG